MGGCNSPLIEERYVPLPSGPSTRWRTDVGPPVRPEPVSRTFLRRLVSSSRWVALRKRFFLHPAIWIASLPPALFAPLKWRVPSRSPS